MNSMGNKTAGAQAYSQVSVHTGVNEASPHRLIQMLIDAAIDKVAAAKGLMANGKIAEKGKTISLAVAIIDSLRASLDRAKGGEIADNLEMLYDYMIRRLTEANVKNDPAILDEVSNLLKPIKEAWDAIPEDIKEHHQRVVMDAESQAAAG